MVQDFQSTHQPQPSDERLTRAAFDLIQAASDCASFCEHIEHNEPTTTVPVVAAGRVMRRIAAELATQSGLSLRQAYEARIRQVEATSLLACADDASTAKLVGADALSNAKCWDEVQLAQVAHDRHFHPDVFGLSKVDQLRHYTFHVTKLAGLLTSAIDQGSWEAFRDERLADIAVFGVKLATVCNERLPSAEVDLL